MLVESCYLDILKSMESNNLFLGPSWPWSYGNCIYYYLCTRMLWFQTLLRRGLLDTICDNVCQWLEIGRWFSPVPSTNKTNRQDITEIYCWKWRYAPYIKSSQINHNLYGFVSRIVVWSKHTISNQRREKKKQKKPRRNINTPC